MKLRGSGWTTRFRPRAVLGVAVVLFPSLARAQVKPGPDGTLPFKDIIFVEHQVVGGSEFNGNALSDQYLGHNSLRGGGLFLLKNFQSANPEKVDIVAGLNVPAGSVNAGQALSSGTFLSPDLSYDGKSIVFSWSSGGGDKWQAKNRFHIFRVDVDGKNLAQLTDGDFDDIHPAWMPNGRIVFVSTRRGGYARDHGRPVPNYTLHSMKTDGTDIIRLSHHESSEFHPSIANDGRIVYMRRDYIDRDSLSGHHIWFCNPDGTNPRSWGGNYALPLDTFTGSAWSDGRKNGKRPMCEFYPRAIPGSATRFVAVAGPHHGLAFGTLILRDFAIKDDNELGQVTKLTPEVGLPETTENGAQVYGTPWPLSETLYLANYNNTLAVVDTSTKPVTLTPFYTQTGATKLRPIYPIPVAARTPPRAIPPATYQGERWWREAPASTVRVNNVNITDDYGKLPSTVRIASMRIVQVLPKTTPNANSPQVGFSSQNVAKMVLGTVPVEADGSVFFEAPVGKLIFFQLLDDKGMAVQSMRSATYLHPGESLTCIGCHEDKLSPPPTVANPTAFGRAPSKMEPELGRVEPVNYHRFVEPILAKKCVPCHKEKSAGPTDSSYAGQQAYAWWYDGGPSAHMAPNRGGSRSKPGRVGARESGMGQALLDLTHQKAQADGAYTATEVRTLTQWLDIGSDEFGVFEGTALQAKGELVWPTLDVDKEDPQGMKYKPENPVFGPPPVTPADAGQVKSGDGSQAIPTDPTLSDAGSPAPDATGPTGGGAGGVVASTGGAGGAGSLGSSSGEDGSVNHISTAQLKKSGCQCTVGVESSTRAHAWVLLVLGLALLARGRRGAR